MKVGVGRGEGVGEWGLGFWRLHVYYNAPSTLLEGAWIVLVEAEFRWIANV